MTGQIAARIQFALAGAVGGALLWAVYRAVEEEWIAHYPGLALFGLVLSGIAAFLALAGPMGAGRGLPRALALGLAVVGLTLLTKLRYAEADDLLNSPMPVLALMVVATLPLPFLIAAARTGWRDYPVLFLEAWSIVLRLAAAGTFTGLVWLVVYLSDEVLGTVGIEVIGRLMGHNLAVLVLSGAVFGLGVAVIDGLVDQQAPTVVLRVLRLFLPVVLAVMLVFLLALPFRGLDGLVSGLSPAGLLLAMVAGGIGLVSITLDRSDADAAQSPLLRRSAQAMALILPVVAGLALYAIVVRVDDYGWTPERIFVASIAAVGVCYGLVYAGSVLRGAPWMEHIRQGNIGMALVSLALAVLWLTPVLNAERISAQSQLARFVAGKTPVDALDVYTLRSWGKPGAAVLSVLEARSTEPGQEALAKLLSSGTAVEVPDHARLVASLAQAMPVQPATATATRTVLLDAVDIYQLQDWQKVCEMELIAGRSGCLMVVADLLPSRPGEEAMLFLQRSQDYTEITGVYLDDAGQVVFRPASHSDGRYIEPAEASALMRQFQEAPPPVTGAALNQLGTGGDGLLFLP